MKSKCPNCNTSLDGGDIYEVMLEQYNGNKEQAKRAAECYGYYRRGSEKRFNRTVIVEDQDDKGRKTRIWYMCPDCKGEIR